jgi:hypothetical protein
MVKQYIRILHHLYRMNNFQSLMAVMAGTRLLRSLHTPSMDSWLRFCSSSSPLVKASTARR